MTRADFRRIALSFPETEERAHMGHPDFRVGGKIFATLGHPDKKSGMVKLAPEDQHNFLREHPAVFNPCSGAWGRQGATNVLLSTIDKPTLERALLAAWRYRASKTLLQEFEAMSKG